MSDYVQRSRGRPRQHETPSARAHASRLKRGIKKVTVDVPEKFAGHVQRYAASLREMKEEKAIKEFSIKPFAWSDGKDRMRSDCLYQIDFQDISGNNIVTRLSARVVHNTDQEGVIPKTFKWTVTRWISLIETVEEEVGCGQCNTLEFGKEICQSVMLACFRGWE